jgi:hypothetical protein
LTLPEPALAFAVVTTTSPTERPPRSGATTAGLRSDVIDAIGAWLADGARSASSSQDVLTELCERLLEAGRQNY